MKIKTKRSFRDISFTGYGFKLDLIISINQTQKIIMTKIIEYPLCYENVEILELKLAQ